MIQSEVYVDKTNFKGIMGLSDQIRDDLYLEDGVYTLWNRNSNSPPADGLLPGKNSHGSSPFYMGKGTDAKWFGVYHNTVAASDWWIFNDETQGTTTIDTYSVGGIGDIYIMFADTPDAVITKYQSIVGKPVLQPQWALGWH
jgi:alpha-glucosidase (family GH31 glycosyl hydrolase)